MDKLGIEPIQLLTQIVNFTVMIVVFKVFLYKPILKILDKRKKEIAQGLALTAKLQEEEAKISQNKDNLLSETKKEASDIIEAAKRSAKEAQKDILADAHSEAASIIEKAKEDAERFRQDVSRDVKKEAVNLAAAMARRLLTESMSEADQHKMLGSHIKKLESSMQ